MRRLTLFGVELPSEMYGHLQNEPDLTPLGVVEKYSDVISIAKEYCEVFGEKNILFSFVGLSEIEYRQKRNETFAKVFKILLNN